MGDLKKIINQKELEEEKGKYYPYIMQIMGAPVLNGNLVPVTDLKRFPVHLIEGVFQTLIGVCHPHKLEDGSTDYSDKIFPKISKEEFKFSMVWAISDLFFGGCEPEDFDEDKAFEFFEREEKYMKPEDDFKWTGVRKTYGDILVD